MLAPKGGIDLDDWKDLRIARELSSVVREMAMVRPGNGPTGSTNPSSHPVLGLSLGFLRQRLADRGGKVPGVLEVLDWLGPR